MLSGSTRPRRMRIGDIDEVARVHLGCFPPAASALSVLGREGLRTAYAYAITEPETTAVVPEAPEAGRVVGFAAATLAPGFNRRFLRRRFARVSVSVVKHIFGNADARNALWARLRSLRTPTATDRPSPGAALPEASGVEAFFLEMGVDVTISTLQD